MTKAELVDHLAKETGLAKTAVQKTLEAILAQTIRTLQKEGRFVLAGLGAFIVVRRAKRKSRNLRTWEPVPINAHKAVRFRPSKIMKDALC